MIKAGNVTCPVIVRNKYLFPLPLYLLTIVQLCFSTETLTCPVCTAVCDVLSASSRLFLAMAFMMLIYTTWLKTNLSVAAYNGNVAMGMLFTFAMHCSFDRLLMTLYLICALTKTSHVLIAYQAVHLFITRLFSLHLKSTTTMLILWLIVIITISNKNLKDWSRGLHLRNIFESTRRMCAGLGQLMFLVSFYCSLAILPSLTQFIQSEFNSLNFLFHLQLFTYPQNSRTPRKYVIFVRIYRLI